MSERVPELLVEKLALGELPDDEAKAVRERLGDEADARLDAVRRSNEEILEDHPPGEIAAAVRRRLEERKAERRPARGGWWLALPTVAAAAGMLIWIGTGEPGDVSMQTTEPPVSDGGESPEVIVLKGDARLVIQRRRGAEDVLLEDGDTVRVGDLLQVSYQSGGAAQGVIFSMDGRGVVTLHHPEKPKRASTALASGGSIALPTSYELDDAPEYERFFFVTGDHVDVETVANAAVRLSKQADAETAPLQLPDGMQQQSILLRKE